jgi:hypothetical protein
MLSKLASSRPVRLAATWMARHEGRRDFLALAAFVLLAYLI